MQSRSLMNPAPLRSGFYAFLLFLGFSVIFEALPAQMPSPEIDSLRAKIEAAATDSQRVELYLELFIATRFSPAKEALDLVGTALPVAERWGDPHSLGMVWLWKGVALDRIGDFQGCIDANQQALQHFARAEDAKMEVSCRINIAGAYMKMGKPEEGVKLFELALEQARSENDPQLLAIAQNNVAISYAARGEYEQAETYFLDALDTQLQAGDSVEIANAAGNLGRVNLKTGDYKKAVEFFVYAAEIEEQIGHRSAMATSFYNIALVFEKMKDFSPAIEYADQALEIYRETGNSVGEIMCLGVLGNLKRELGDNDEAFRSYSKGVRISRELGLENEPYGQCLYGIGKYWKEKGNLATALGLLEEARKVFAKTGFAANLPSVDIEMGEIYKAQERFQQAEERYLLARGAASKFGDLRERMEAHKGLASLYEVRQKPIQALREFKFAESLEDSIFSIESSREIADIQIKYDSERKKRQLAEEKQQSERLRYENELIQRRNEMNMQIAVAGILFLIVLSSGVWMWSRQKRLLSEKEKALALEQLKSEQSQRSHLESLAAQQATEIGTRTRLFSEIKLELERIKEKYSEDKPIEFMHLFKVVELNIRSEGDWEAFKENFERLHPSFLDHLHARHPSLSPAEQRLCVLVRLNMSKKDIANILNIHPDSVKRSRNRLRHKLEIDQSVDLKKYLHTI